MPVSTAYELHFNPTILQGPGVWRMLQVITSNGYSGDDLVSAARLFSHVQWGAFMMAMGYRRNYDNRPDVVENIFFEEGAQTDYPKVLRALAFAMDQVLDAEDFADRRNGRDDERLLSSHEPSWREDFHADG